MLFTNPNPQFCDANGKPYSGGKLYFYEIGTTTAKSTYSDSGMTSANAQPVVLDSDGRPGSQIFFTGLARVILKTSANVQVFDADNYGFLGDVDSYGLINSGTTFDGIGVASVTSPATGRFTVTFDSAATGTNKQCVQATASLSTGLSAMVVNTSTTVVDIYLRDTGGTSVSNFPINITRRLFL